MKTKNVLLALLIGLILTACTSKMTLVNSSSVPAATGAVVVKKDKNENYGINLTVTNLAEPSKLSPTKNVYVVWMDNGNGTNKKLGQIVVSSGTFSKAIKGNFTTTSTVEPTKIFITAENSVDVLVPEGEVVMKTN